MSHKLIAKDVFTRLNRSSQFNLAPDATCIVLRDTMERQLLVFQVSSTIIGMFESMAKDKTLRKA